MRFNWAKKRGVDGLRKFLRVGRVGRPRRWVRLTVCLLAMAATLVAAVLVLLHHLDDPWVKRRVQAIARSSAGIDLNYARVRFGLLTGVEVDDVVVQSPAEFRDVAPSLLRVGHVEVHWSLRSLVGRAPILTRAAIADVDVTVVVDAAGRNSFDAIPKSNPSLPSAPSDPLSRRSASIFSKRPPIGEVAIERVRVDVLRVAQGGIAQRTELRGISAKLVATPSPSATDGWRANLMLGTPAMPLVLDFSNQTVDGTKGARATLWFTLEATKEGMNGALDVRGVEQSFAPSLPSDLGFHAEAHLKFDPAANRTLVDIAHTATSDGSVNAEASIEVPDFGDPILRFGRGDIDVARLLGWIPPGLAPFTATASRAAVHYEFDSLVVGEVPHLSRGGKASFDADVAGLLVRTHSRVIRLSSVGATIRGGPLEGVNMAYSALIRIDGARIEDAGDLMDVDPSALSFDAMEGVDGTVTGAADLRVSRLTQRGAMALEARDARAQVHVGGLHWDAKAVLKTAGDIDVTLGLGSLDVKSQRARAIANGLTAHAHVPLAGHSPLAVSSDISANRLRLIDHDGKVYWDAAARIEASARDIEPDFASAIASKGACHITANVGEVHASLEATKSVDDINVSVEGTARSLKFVRPFLPVSLSDAAPWDRMGLSWISKAHVEHLSGNTPEIRQTTELTVERPAYKSAAARNLSVILESDGNAHEHHADLDVRARGLAFNGGEEGDEHLVMSAAVKRDLPSLNVAIATTGRAAAKASASLSYDRNHKAVLYDVNANIGALAPLAPFIAKVVPLNGVDWSKFELAFSTKGTLGGVVAGVNKGVPTMEAHPKTTATLDGNADLRVHDVKWSSEDKALVLPSLAWHGDMRTDGGSRTLRSRLDVASLHVDLGSRDVDLKGLTDVSSLALKGDLDAADVLVTDLLTVRAIDQDIVPEYRVGDFTLRLSAERGPEGVIHISDMRMNNGLGGTTLAAAGNVDLGEGRNTLSITTTLAQDLTRLVSIPDRFRGRGNVSVEGNVTSPDFARYDVRATVKGEGVTASLPRAGIEVEDANAEVPITLALEVGEHGVALERHEKGSAYSMLRFADQHPLRNRSGFLSIARLGTPLGSIAPLVGNLEIEQNVISLHQFEMGVRGGSITGQSSLDWDGAKSKVELHIRATGVQSSHGEPFDGNIAVAISAADRTIEGRAEILRIGEQHLLDLLDLQDPLHVDPGFNRIRTALIFGYPDSVRLVFDHGFASAHLELEGLARLVSIGDLRGIPTGPLFDKVLGRMLDRSQLGETR